VCPPGSQHGCPHSPKDGGRGSYCLGPSVPQTPFALIPRCGSTWDGRQTQACSASHPRGHARISGLSASWPPPCFPSVGVMEPGAGGVQPGPAVGTLGVPDATSRRPCRPAPGLPPVPPVPWEHREARTRPSGPCFTSGRRLTPVAWLPAGQLGDQYGYVYLFILTCD